MPGSLWFLEEDVCSVTDIAQAMRKIVQRNHEILFQKVIDSWKPD